MIAAQAVVDHPTCSPLPTASNIQTFDIHFALLMNENLSFLKIKVFWDQIHCFGCSLYIQIDYFIPVCVAAVSKVWESSLSWAYLIKHIQIIKHVWCNIAHSSCLCKYPQCQTWRLYCITVGRGEEHHHETKIDAVYLLTMLRNDFNTHQQKQSRGRMIDEPALTPDRSDVTSLLRFLSFCWESYPYVIQRLLSRRLSAVTPSSLHGTKKNACCQSRQSKVASSKLTVRGETIHPNTQRTL
jgi:hypothetical protein